MAGRHLLILPALLGGCESLEVHRDAILPTQLSLLVEDDAGQPLSVVMDLRRNTRNQLDVRVSEGLRLFDGRRLWALESVPAGEGFHVRLTEELGRVKTRDLPVESATRPEVVSFDRMEVWLSTSGGLVHCALEEPRCERADEPARSPLDHMGPGRGFHVELTPTGDLRLSLPLDPDDQGQTILTNVKRVIGAHWVHEGFLERDPILDRTFRGRASLVAVPRAVALDGNLGEWGSAEPLVVDSPWQLFAGAPDWSGPLDASFSVTASRTADGVCFAGRIRDDHFVEGDRMMLHAGDATVDLPLATSMTEPGRVVVAEWFGRRVEVCVPEHLSETGRMPFFASLTDVDPTQADTVLASAPVDDPSAAGSLKASP